MARIFISYSHKDETFARRLAADLDRLGAEVLIDVDDVYLIDDWVDMFHQTFNDCDLIIVVISPESSQSTNISQKWKYFNDQGKPVLTVLLMSDSASLRLANPQYIEFNAQDYDSAFARLHFELGRQGIPLASLPTMKIQALQPLRLRISHVSDLLPPPFEWIEIPAGRVTLISEKEWSANYVPKGQSQAFGVSAFMIDKYPITNAQYAKFLEAGGYREKKWWTAAGWEAREQGLDWNSDKRKWEPSGTPWTEPRGWQYSERNGADYPVEGVSWYESIAFCRWLSDTTEENVQLPTEQQWQRAAQGDDNRIYPWGNEWDGWRCNNSVPSQSSNHATPVTQYPTGASPYGVMDMSGNMLEWCLTT